MQNTANMWVLLCEELENRRKQESAIQQSEAARTFEQAAKQVFGEKSPRLRDALEIAGDIHHAAGFADEAVRCFREANGMASKMGADPVRARISTKLALILEQEEDLEGAGMAYAEAIAAFLRLHDRSQLPTLLNNLAGIKKRLGDFVEAERGYLLAIEEARQSHGKENPEVALIANNLGVAYTEAGRLQDAELLHLQALGIRERNFGGNHPEVAQSLSNLGVVYHEQNAFSKAEAFYRSALEILRNFREENDPEVQRIRANFNRLPTVRPQSLKKTRKM